MSNIKVAILGTRGIPNSYGGFEQFAEYLSVGLAQRDFEVTVYNSHLHPYQESKWNGVTIIHCYDPEKELGTIGQFIYDLNCILDCRKRNFDIVLQLGYTSSSVWFKLLSKSGPTLTTNMDGHEWKRTKYSRPVQLFLKFAEKLAVRHSHYLIADSIAIQSYLKIKYKADSTFIPYGADIFNLPDERVLNNYQLQPHGYDVIIARFERENNIETILNGVEKSTFPRICVIIGNCETPYARHLREKFSKNKNFRFLNGIYNIATLNSIRYFSCLYFHGHSVGGTNPSLLEAMASHALICAHDNEFNAAILGPDAYYFKTSSDIVNIITAVNKSEEINKGKISNNIKKIEVSYSWNNIVQQYINHFDRIRAEKKDLKIDQANFRLSVDQVQLQNILQDKNN